MVRFNNPIADSPLIVSGVLMAEWSAIPDNPNLARTCYQGHIVWRPQYKGT